MKAILSLLLLPIMMLAQPRDQHQKGNFNITFSMNFDSEPLLDREINFQEAIASNIEFTITLEVYVETLEFNPRTSRFTDYETVAITPPQYLNTFSLVGLYSNPSKESKPQERLNHLLALNDPRFPKENTLINILNPVAYKLNRPAGMKKAPQGFGPLIRI